METANDRLTAVRTALGFVRKADFAEVVGIERSTYDKMEKGPNKPSADNLEKIAARYPDINLNWLLTGHGEMLLSRLPAPGPTTGPETVAHGDTLIQLARAEALVGSQAAQLAAQAVQIERLWAELGKSGGSSEAASTWRLPMLPVMGREMAYAGR